MVLTELFGEILVILLALSSITAMIEYFLQPIRKYYIKWRYKHLIKHLTKNSLEDCITVLPFSRFFYLPIQFTYLSSKNELDRTLIQRIKESAENKEWIKLINLWNLFLKEFEEIQYNTVLDSYKKALASVALSKDQLENIFSTKVCKVCKNGKMSISREPKEKYQIKCDNCGFESLLVNYIDKHEPLLKPLISTIQYTELLL